MNDFSKKRIEMVAWIKKQLSGSVTLDSEDITTPNPFNFYTIGILYPNDAENEECNDTDDLDLASDDVAKSYVQDKKNSFYQPPSSMGFSFYVSNDLEYIRISYNAVTYSENKGKGTGRADSWTKTHLGDKGLDDGSKQGIKIDRSSQHIVYDGLARIDVVVRPHGDDGKIITVTLSNTKASQDSDTEQQKESIYKTMAENSLFEVELQCHFDKDALRNYPRIDKTLFSEEEKELELRYKDQPVYAIGHAIAVDWREVENNEINIFSDFMPMVEVPQVTADTASGHDKTLQFNFLTTIEKDSSVIEKLYQFVDNYEIWIQTQQGICNQETENDDQLTSQRIIKRMRTAVKRMRASIVFLNGNIKAKQAFAIANEAMQMQMQANDKTPNNFGWRPFQLAFLLTTLESCVSQDSEFRDVVDLIWFPTGGGKTEAYLGVMAFMFVLRRLNNQISGGGTVAIMRYTLRLLTTQQFQRACKVIFALDLIRQKTPKLGNEPFTIGLWTGGATSPNKFTQALHLYETERYNQFVLQSCPWCKQAFNKKNYKVGENNFHFCCTNTSCDFHGENQVLPCNVVDEALYNNPPTLLISTVDKFARFAWEERSNVFLGGEKNLPPELIIQDELHLISDALGSVVGLYEVGLETAIRSRKMYPKFIASTATIRQAKEQVKTLFGRDMAVFPPVGLRQNDSYFAREVPLSEKAGRLYVGYMAFFRQKKDCLEDLATNILTAPKQLFADNDELLDAWWTTMYYHGSIKSVGNSRTCFQNGISRRQRQILNQIHPPANMDQIYTPEEKQAINNAFRFTNIKSLTGNQSASESGTVFNALKNKYPNKKVIDAVLATNMVSVGLDEPRLASMVINGQPLTTAEYIQASSRVGRGKIPGVVYINYYKTQSRSLSNYENFKTYHNSFYRYVEPSSLTPFTEQVCNRALHAAFVLAIRHVKNGLLRNEQAYDFDKDLLVVKQTVQDFKARVAEAFEGDMQVINEQLEGLINQWIHEKNSSSLDFRYQNSFKERSYNALLTDFDNPDNGLWQTLNSMRHVEQTAITMLDSEPNRFGGIDTSWFANIRLSHITRNSGVCSVVRDSNDLLIRLHDTRRWNKKGLVELHAVERVKHYVKEPSKKLFLPPVAQITKEKPIEVDGDTIPASIFPLWTKCKKCHHIDFNPWQRCHNLNQPIRCGKCQNGILEQLPWCAISNDGELQEVNWHQVCHAKGNKSCRQDHNQFYMKIINNHKGQSEIICSKCQSKNIIDNTVFEYNDTKYRVVEINDPRVYSPLTERALVIPPESNINRESLEYKVTTNSQMLHDILNAKRNLQRKKAIKKATNFFKCTKEDLESVIKQIENSQNEPIEMSLHIDNMQNDEYDAFMTQAEFPIGADFVTRHVTEECLTHINDNLATDTQLFYASKFISTLVAVDRLRVIEVFKGFSRNPKIESKSREDSDNTKGNETLDVENTEVIVPPDIEGNADWLPAIELFGEGMFFSLDIDVLKQWESNQYVRLRVQKLVDNYQKSNVQFSQEPIITPRFVLLHTLAHIMIKQLESLAGYPAASLQERIYADTTTGMAGILIYTAVPDKAGSLGGILRQVEPKNFLALWIATLEDAEWCSLDPVCGEMTEKGVAKLNHAACHGCVLIPDTACEYGNLLLDRVLIKGSDKDNIPSLLDSLKNKE